MLRSIAKLITIPFALGLAAPVLAIAAERPSPDRGVLVLRNGEIIEGRIATDGDAYVVDLSDGRIRVKRSDVEFACRDLDEGYRRKRAAIQVGNVHDHLELAQWCLRHDLFGPASDELSAAAAADPNNPMVAVLRRRLKMALEPTPTQKSKAARPPGPSNDELDRMVRSLPHGAVESFTQSVQPVLMNHCTGSGCHGLQSESSLKLIRISAGRSPSRRFTQRNLFAALQYVDRENPLASKLLTAAGKPHGTMQHPVFSPHEASQYKRLIDWVALATQHDLSDASAAIAPPAKETDAPPLAQSSPRRLPPEANEANPLPRPERGKTSRKKDGDAKDDAGATKPAWKTAPRASVSDPFDPEAFNRQTKQGQRSKSS